MKAYDYSNRQSENALTAPAGAVLFILTGIIAYLCWLMVSPFVSALTWALALVVVLNPIRTRLLRRFSKTTTAVVMLAVVIISIGVALYFVSNSLISEIPTAQNFVRALVQPDVWQRVQNSPSWFGRMFRWARSEFDLLAILQDFLSTMARAVAPAFGKSALGVSRAILSLFFFFFFVRDEEALIAAFRRTLPLKEQEMDHLFDRIALTVQATVIGRIAIGAIQGAIGGLLFLALGIPAPAFWGLAMAIFSMLPVIGAFVIWVPAAAMLLFSGHWMRALILVAGGVVLIHPVDNIIYPLLVGPRAGLHPTVLLIAFVGGLIAFGPPGLVLGPLIATMAAVLAEIWHQRNNASASV